MAVTTQANSDTLTTADRLRRSTAALFHGRGSNFAALLDVWLDDLDPGQSIGADCPASDEFRLTLSTAYEPDAESIALHFPGATGRLRVCCDRLAVLRGIPPGGEIDLYGGSGTLRHNGKRFAASRQNTAGSFGFTVTRTE